MRVDERVPFTLLCRGWLVRYDPRCCGLTVLERVGGGATGEGSDKGET